MFIRQTFGFEQKPKTINSMFKIGLRRCFTPLLQFIEIVLYLFWIQFCREALKMESYGGQVTAVVVESSWASTQDRNIAFKALQKFCKAANFATGTIEVFVVP